MKPDTSIDLTLRDRHTILSLLKQVEAETVSVAEMEEIGEKLNRAGRSALSPLVRRIRKEEKGEIISRYAFLLDFFDDETWHDQLVEILFKRHDMERNGALALVATLEAHGVDLQGFPLADSIFRRWPLPESFLSLLGDEEKLADFIDDFLFQEPDDRLAVIREIAKNGEPHVIPLFEILSAIDDPGIRTEIIMRLGRIRSVSAATLLQKIGEENDLPYVRTEVLKSLRRLSFLGILPENRSRAKIHPVCSACVSPVDGGGYRIIWLCRPGSETGFVVVTFQVHDLHGINSVWGMSRLSADECSMNAAALNSEEGAVEVSPDYALALLREALFRSGEATGGPLPGEYYVWRRQMTPEEVRPEQYHPRTAVDGLSPAITARYVASGDSLFDHDFFAGWVLVSPAVYDYAERWLDLETQGISGRSLKQQLEQLVKEFCRLLIQPELETIRRRLLLIADLLQETDSGRELVEQSLAVADSMAKPLASPHLHPFLRRFALESMDMAKEALREGHDLRLECGRFYDV